MPKTANDTKVMLRNDSIVGILRKEPNIQQGYVPPTCMQLMNFRSRKTSHATFKNQSQRESVVRSGVNASGGIVTIVALDSMTDFIEIEVKKPSGNGRRAKSSEIKHNIFSNLL